MESLRLEFEARHPVPEFLERVGPSYSFKDRRHKYVPEYYSARDDYNSTWEGYQSAALPRDERIAELETDRAVLTELCDLLSRTVNADNGLMLPLREQTPGDLDKWTTVIVTILKNVGMYEVWKEQQAALSQPTREGA